MTFRMIPLCALILAALLAACATVPAGMGPAFDTAMSHAKADTNPYAADATLSELLSNASLSDDQRARVLYARGSLCRQAGDDRRGAVKYFEAMLALAPDHPLAPNAKEELEFARSDVETIEAGLQRMLNLTQWFDSMWVLGDHDTAVARYRASGLNPNEAEIVKLAAAGYVCPDADGHPPVYTLGDMRPDLENLYWCSGPGA
ncbi:hypothetical protein [Hyphomonas sp.]|jgi:tetratricopeptide (TPR) repeat protein|uniref:hypothetical protein n=1 Tax=Hyphomonas sp. TaxID=87 RepID=UPI0039E3DC4E